MAQADKPTANSPSVKTIPSALSLEALDRLSQLHAESAGNTQLARFLSGGANAAGAVMLLAMAALVFEAEASLAACFGWALLVLAGVGSLLFSYIRSTAAGFDRAPMEKAAGQLRGLLLYAGAAWGAGAFLILPLTAGPLIALTFAGLPSLVLAWLLKDRSGPLLFLVPVSLATLAAALLRPWTDPGLTVALLLMLQSSIAAHIILQSRRAQDGLPAGLLLR